MIAELYDLLLFIFNDIRIIVSISIMTLIYETFYNILNIIDELCNNKYEVNEIKKFKNGKIEVHINEINWVDRLFTNEQTQSRCNYRDVIEILDDV